MEITFNDIPLVLARLCEDVAFIKSQFSKTATEIKPEASQWFTIDQLCNYLPDRPAKSTVYTWTHKNLIPYYKSGKKVRFLKTDIDAWLLDGRRMTHNEIDNEVDNFLSDCKMSNT